MGCHCLLQFLVRQSEKHSGDGRHREGTNWGRGELLPQILLLNIGKACFEGAQKDRVGTVESSPGGQLGSHEEGFGNDESWLRLVGAPCRWKDATGGLWGT